MADDPIDISNWQRLSPSLTTSGRLHAQDIARLAAIGVRHVINLALDSHPEALAQEAELLAQAGLRYTHIPVPFDAPTSAQFIAFADAIAATDGAVHVHCIRNWRVSAFCYRLYRQHGMTDGEATAIMRQQWDPRVSDDARAAVWAQFIA